MFSSHSLIQSDLVNNVDDLVNVIKQSLNLKFAKSKKFAQDYLLNLVQENKASWDFKAEILYDGAAAEPKGQMGPFGSAGNGLLNTLGTLNLRMLWRW